MGDLDDAIREHLELKRRRGADPAEVARQEHDALAPVTRTHPIVSMPPREADSPLERDERPATNGSSQAHAEEDLSDATQEFHVHFADDGEDDDDDWLQGVERLSE